MFEEFIGLSPEQAKQYCTAPISSLKDFDQHIIHRMVDIAKEAGGNVLDVGCGTGRVTQFFHKNDYYGVDISPQVIKVAKERHPEHHFELLDARKITFDDNYFNTVMCAGMLPHMPNQGVAIDIIKEMWRVTKKQLLITWSTIPGATSDIRRVSGHFGLPTYQNRYCYQDIKDAMPNGTIIQINAGACALWKVKKD